MSLWPFRSRTESPATTPADPVSAEPVRQEGPVNILRHLEHSCIQLDLAFQPCEIPEDENDSQRERRLVHDKEGLIQELTNILDRSGAVVNPTKFYKDMVNRERKATTAIAPGIAIPHVRTLQCRRFIMGFARSRLGLNYGSLDGGPTHLFFLLASPPYEDKLYLKVYRELAELIREEWVREALMAAQTPNDVLSVLRGVLQ